MAEGGDRTTAAVGGQTGHGGALKQKGQQLGLGEDARYQLAVLDVVTRQRRFVLGEHTVDFVHALVWRVDGLAFAQQGLRDVLKAERGKAPGRRAQCLDTVNDQPPADFGEKVVVTTAVLTPAHRFPATPEPQRHLQALSMFVQDPQVELHHVPANDRVGVVQRQPVVQTLEQLRAGVAIIELKIQRLVATIGRAEHVHLALAAALQRNGIQLAPRRGFDVQRHQFQPGPVIRCRPDLRVTEHAICIGRAAELHGCGDEALHQITFGRTDVGFVDIDVASAQQFFDVHQLSMLLAIHPQHRTVAKIAQFQRAQFNATLGTQ